MIESVSPAKTSKRYTRRSNVKSILKAAAEVGAASVDFGGGIVVRLKGAPPTAPATGDEWADAKPR